MRILRIAIPVLMLVLWGCSSHEDLEPPDNPFDPGNPDYVSPLAEIISGPSEGETIDTTVAIFTWEGNETATEFSYQFNDSDWSAWTANTSAVFDYLDEGVHSFKVRSRSINGDAQEIPAELDFNVDAVQGPSALVYPYKQSGSPGDTLVYQIIAEEVADLFAVQCRVSYDSNLLELTEVFDGTLKNEWGGTILSIQDVDVPIINLSMVPVENTNQSFSGTASVLSVKLRIKANAPSTSETAALTIEQIELLNPQLEVLTTASKRSGVLNVW